MQYRDYETIAQAIRQQVNMERKLDGAPLKLAIIRGTATRIAMAIAVSDQRFDPERFMRACGLNGLEQGQ